jgi:hypothetical protein|tara:strand:- start:11 stop:475 length:465 start_codon:yes stop_codon:yes gene_type:complete
MLAAVISLFGGPFGGFLSGILGSGIGAITDYFKKKQELQAQLAKQAHEVKLLEMNISARGQEMESEQAIAQIEATAAMMKGSYQHDASYGQASPWAVNLLRMIRPTLTLVLILLTAVVYWQAEVGEQSGIVATVLYLTEVAVTWWFADRARGKK